MTLEDSKVGSHVMNWFSSHFEIYENRKSELCLWIPQYSFDLSNSFCFYRFRNVMQINSSHTIPSWNCHNMYNSIWGFWTNFTVFSNHISESVRRNPRFFKGNVVLCVAMLHIHKLHGIALKQKKYPLDPIWQKKHDSFKR